MLPAELRFELLGPVRAWYRDAELDLGSPQQRGVLAVLLLARGRQVSLETLIDALWGDRPPQSAASTVRTYILRLRRCLDLGAVRAGGEVIRLVGDGYSLEPGSAVLDLARFEERVRGARAARDDLDIARAAGLFRDALALWQGMPLAGIAGPYARVQRARLSELHAAAAEDGLAADIGSGAHQAAIPELQTLRDSYPLREKLTELLMLALYRSGRQADALAVFDDSRRVLRDELGIDPGPALREMHQRILQTDSRLTLPAPPSASRREAPVPALLPPDRADFTGRADTLAAIFDVLTDGANTPVVAIDGLAGIGKTALAVRAARAVQFDYPDGQLYVELGDSAGAEAGPAGALATFLRALGFTAIPETLDQRVAAWRSAMAGQRMIIVLDDASEAAQVLRLLPPPPGCAYIVTGRRRLLDLPGAHFFAITRLRPPEALSLLERLVGPERVATERAAAERLVDACSCQPLAVRTAATRLAARPGWLIADMHRQLLDELSQPLVIHADCELVEAPFQSAYSRLTAAEALAFRRAGTREGLDIPVDAVAALLDISGHMALSLLDALADVHLVEPSGSGYHFDPLVKLFARRLAIAEDSLHRSEPAGRSSPLAGRRLAQATTSGTARSRRVCGGIWRSGTSPSARGNWPPPR